MPFLKRHREEMNKGEIVSGCVRVLGTDLTVIEKTSFANEEADDQVDDSLRLFCLLPSAS